MSGIESRLERLEALSGEHGYAICFWFVERCPACGARMWRERTTGRTRELRAGENQNLGIYRAPDVPPPPHACKTTSGAASSSSPPTSTSTPAP